MISAESNPDNLKHIEAVSTAMRIKLNQVLKAAGVTHSMGHAFLYNPGGQEDVEVRENLNAKEFVNAVNFITDSQRGYISAESRKKLFETLNAGLAPTRIAKPVTVEEEVGDAVKKSDDADKQKVEEAKKKPAKRSLFKPWTWLNGGSKVEDKKESSDKKDDDKKKEEKKDDSILEAGEDAFFWDRWAVAGFNKIPDWPRKKLRWLYKQNELLDPTHDRFMYKLPPKKDK